MCVCVCVCVCAENKLYHVVTFISFVKKNNDFLFIAKGRVLEEALMMSSSLLWLESLPNLVAQWEM